jgi:hypothetical protein
VYESNGNRFWATVMVDAQTSTSLEQSFRAMAIHADLMTARSTGEKAGQVVARWLANLHQDRDWLLIFDGANDPKINWEDYLPPGVEVQFSLLQHLPP